MRRFKTKAGAERETTVATTRIQLSGRKALSLTCSIGALVALLAFAGGAAGMTSTGGAAPWVTSDKADYNPASTVHLTGGNWQPGEPVEIVTNDTVGNSWSKTDNVTADDTGAITDDVVLPNFFVSDYTVTATGAQSGTATTTFTDAASLTLSPLSGPTGQRSPQPRAAVTRWERHQHRDLLGRDDQHDEWDARRDLFGEQRRQHQHRLHIHGSRRRQRGPAQRCGDGADEYHQEH